MNKKTRDKLRKNPLGWTPNLHTAALDYIDQLEGQAPPTLSEKSRPVVPAILDQYTGPVRLLLLGYLKHPERLGEDLAMMEEEK